MTVARKPTKKDIAIALGKALERSSTLRLSEGQRQAIAASARRLTAKTAG